MKSRASDNQNTSCVRTVLVSWEIMSSYEVAADISVFLKGFRGWRVYILVLE
jgi:hypothetical protein